MKVRLHTQILKLSIFMKSSYFLFLAGAFALFLPSCGTRDLSAADRVALSASAMKFGHTGTDLSECGLVSQLERGRSSSSNAGGTG